uniref:Protein kinase-like domain, concanavalin A-like lectin/glucanase domain protein n=1 Tax=Tanacetum cinerariifolium TaxID=118510 RepID=A0A6L2NWG1_TANCI|nr:protein kinase-like domain, concanavalin A-like lectin/glucanase domain protein [Tanacetum cinerariifolium]
MSLNLYGLCMYTSLRMVNSLSNILKAFGGNTRDMGLFGEETDKTTNLHQHLSRLCSQRLETASQITRDAVIPLIKTVSRESMTNVDLSGVASCDEYACLIFLMEKSSISTLHGQVTVGTLFWHVLILKSFISFLGFHHMLETRGLCLSEEQTVASESWVIPESATHYLDQETPWTPKALQQSVIPRRRNSDKKESKPAKVFKDEESEWETEEEVEEAFDDETKEDDDDTKHHNSLLTIKELVYRKWLLKNPRPSWVKAKIRAENPSNDKISCMIGHILIKHAYIDIESPINIMSRKKYNRIMTYKLGPRKKTSNPNKINNFVGRVSGLRVFIGSLAYKCDFMILEDTTSVIDGYLGEFVFGKPFIDETDLIYNKGEGTIAFGMDNEKITFKMSHVLEIFKQSKLKGLDKEERTTIKVYSLEMSTGMTEVTFDEKKLGSS